ncbi:MAG: hypothetical protein ACREL3_01035 [Gemmatimonadales bacterium]
MDPTEPLVPILRVEEGLADRTALATWHEALSDALGVDIPHDLLGLWLYPTAGAPVLLGPEALAEDSLSVPVPSPQLQHHQLDTLEETIRKAGYASVICVPVRFGRRDVGLMLVADLRPDRYTEGDLLTLRLVNQRLAPLLGRLARQWPTESGLPVPQVERIAALLDAVAHTSEALATPQRFLAALSPALEPLLPHDHLELLLADPAGSRYYRLGEHAGGPLWLDPSLTIGREDLDVEALFGASDRLLLADACRDPRWPRGYFTVAKPAGAEPRGIVGTRVAGPRGVTAFLLAASVGADLYGEADAALLARVGALVAPQVALLVASAGNGEKAPQDSSRDAAYLAEAASLLATSADLGEATRRVRDLAAGFLPFDEMHFAIRLSEGGRVVLLEPGERRLLPDLPLVPVSGTALDQVLKGELPAAFNVVDGESRLAVPLRVGGRIHGALLMNARQSALREAHLRQAQHLADVVAPHLELLRRAALLPPPYLPGWKRTQRNKPPA